MFYFVDNNECRSLDRVAHKKYLNYLQWIKIHNIIKQKHLKTKQIFNQSLASYTKILVISWEIFIIIFIKIKVKVLIFNAFVK